jgi:hypothetical protein
MEALRGDGLMKKIQCAPILVSLLAGAGMAVVCLPTLANVEAECRQEAEDYGIPPEQMGDYVTGCVLSRGGNYTPDPVVQDPDPALQDYTAPPEGDISNDAGIVGDDVPQ